MNELGGFSKLTRGVIFHNTLTASDYAFQDRVTHDPRPNFFAVKLWQDLMGARVFDCGEPVRMGAHVYCQSYKADPGKKSWLIVNNSDSDSTAVEITEQGTLWLLAGKDGNKRAQIITLNGKDLVLGKNWELPDLSGADVQPGIMEIPAMSCAFIVV